MARRRRWIRRAIEHPGALHRELRIPAGRRIPLRTLECAGHQPGKLGERARLALRLRRFRDRG